MLETWLAEARRLADLLGGSVPGTIPPDEGPFVRATAEGFELVWVERGQQTAERAPDGPSLVWMLLRDLSFWQAVAHERANRRPGEDVRRQIFATQLELLDRVGLGARGRAHQAEILARHPYDDRLARRADRWAELIAAGLPREAAVRQAEEEIP